jgi:hypothetical protein
MAAGEAEAQADSEAQSTRQQVSISRDPQRRHRVSDALLRYLQNK